MVPRERCQAKITCVGVTLYFSARLTINGSLRTAEYPVNSLKMISIRRSNKKEFGRFTTRSISCDGDTFLSAIFPELVLGEIRV
jgi:hypothetical protein